MWQNVMMKFMGLAVVVTPGALLPGISSAQIVDVGGATCVQNYAWYDYYSNGELVDSQYEPDGVTCYSSGGGSPGQVPGVGGGGGGTTTPPDLTERDISPELACALAEYLHNNVRLTGGRTMKRVNAWAFGRQGPTGTWGYAFRSANVSPGPGWIDVAGVGSPGTAYARLYNLAFQANTLPLLQGTRFGVPSNSLFGAMSAFEMSLLVAGHEASHLAGNSSNESEANWYGIDAVLSYRADGGARCAN